MNKDKERILENIILLMEARDAIYRLEEDNKKTICAMWILSICLIISIVIISTLIK